MAGYSGTPLSAKLGIKPGAVVALVGAPPHFRALLDPLPDGVTFRPALRGTPDVICFFTTERRALEQRLPALLRALGSANGLWIMWPKRTSKVVTDVTEDVVREVALPAGVVDTKVCAVDDVWSGLRLVWRREHRMLRPAALRPIP